MTECYDDGLLRAHLADARALPATERNAIETHLQLCKSCRARMGELAALEALVSVRMSALAPQQPPDPALALQRMSSRLAAEGADARPLPQIQLTSGNPDYSVPLSAAHGRTPMQATVSHRRAPRPALFTGLVVAVLALSLFAFPGVRATADQLLQTFRARSVVFLPVETSRLEKLRDLQSDPSSLFVGKPEIVGSSNTRYVAALSDAAQAIGFTPEAPTVFPTSPSETKVKVHDQATVRAQVNLDTSRLLLQTLGVTDVTLPDALGEEPVTADVQPFVQSTYSGTGYEMNLVEGRSPTVTLPKGVVLSDLGKAGLRLLGMQPEQADQLSRQIDWSSTLVVPFPQNMSDVLRVQVGDADGLMVTTSTLDGNHTLPGGRHTFIYWQRGDRFYVLEGSGTAITNDAMLIAAKSVK